MKRMKAICEAEGLQVREARLQSRWQSASPFFPPLELHAGRMKCKAVPSLAEALQQGALCCCLAACSQLWGQQNSAPLHTTTHSSADLVLRVRSAAARNHPSFC